MNNWQEINWYAIQSKPHRENLAATAVAELNLEVFLPRICGEQLVCGSWRSVKKPLFTGYFFARFAPLLSIDAVRYAPGVLRVVGDPRNPVPLDEQIIWEIRGRELGDGLIRLETKPLQPGDPVTIEQGPFAGLMGRVERELNDQKRVAILLDVIADARLVIEKYSVAQAAR
jgi:transcription antitermination factor NusG